MNIPELHFQGVPRIHLKGSQYEGPNFNATKTLEQLAQNTGYEESLVVRFNKLMHVSPKAFETLSGGNFYALQAELQDPTKQLDFDNSLALILFVSSALNNSVNATLQSENVLPEIPPLTHLMQASSLLSMLSCMEAREGLTSPQIAWPCRRNSRN